MTWKLSMTREDFQRARRKAFFAQLLAMINRQSNDLLPFEEVRARLNVRAQIGRGLRTVPLRQIIGSEGRYADFDRQFSPLTDTTRARWMRVDHAHLEAIALPAVELYQIGDIYFVRDGHHRISVARMQGQVDIDATVTELIVDVPLSVDFSVLDLLIAEEYSDFLEWTNLAQLRPEQRIFFTEPGGYITLIQHINTHRYFQSLEQGCEIDRDSAITSWYDTVYLPVIQIIRERKVLQAFPRRSEADLYLWIMDHRWYLRERNGNDPGPEGASDDYVRQFGRQNLIRMTERLLRNLVEPLRQIAPESRA
jgi:hypothetical protein